MTELIPEQISGKKVDLSHTAELATQEEAAACFARARMRMLDPGTWHELSGALSAEFILVPQTGTPPHQWAQTHDHIKIDIPGPGPSSGKGYDWVLIELIKDETDAIAPSERVGMRLSPCSDPTGKDTDTAHFFTGQASSTFVITRNGNKVVAQYHGRNEMPNIKTTRTVDNIRNAIVASGALASLSEMQWMSLIKGFLKNE
ncbi:hypothetical protein [Nemorincola caseinilytica]